jgi:hypothetical protein
MPNVDANVISFQCPKCGQDLQQTIGAIDPRDLQAAQDRDASALQPPAAKSPPSVKS